MVKFGQIWARLGKGGQIWMSQTYWVDMGDINSGWMWVFCAGVGVGVGQCSQVWADMGKDGQGRAGLDWAGIDDMDNVWVWVCVQV